MRSSTNQRGFTLLEVMAVCAIIAILATVAMPSFFGESRKAKADTEVSAMFAELGVREEQYKADNGSYLAAAACPSTTSPSGSASSACLGTGMAWTTLRVSPPESTLRCKYQITTGDSSSSVTNPSGFSFTSPPQSWFYILATCDMDGNASVNSTYFTSSVDSAIQALNKGR
jgi:prepilin-type N-terminal cleavage/methylation domain-containing protein